MKRDNTKKGIAPFDNSIIVSKMGFDVFQGPENVIKEFVFSEIQRLFDMIKDNDELGRTLSVQRNPWKDSLISQERTLVEVLENVEDPEVRNMIGESILKYSKQLLNIAEKDLKVVKKDQNPFLNIANEFKNGYDIDGKKRFWASAFDDQKDILKELIKHNINKDINVNTCKAMIQYCDLVITRIKVEHSDGKPVPKKHLVDVKGIKSRASKYILTHENKTYSKDKHFKNRQKYSDFIKKLTSSVNNKNRQSKFEKHKNL